MVVVLSRFRMANGCESKVRAAFVDRPHLVDDAPGFLGLETFVDREDEAVFYLLTRWTDLEAFDSWHGSDAHQASHKYIPGGLKLDATFTRVWRLDKIAD